MQLAGNFYGGCIFVWDTFMAMGHEKEKSTQALQLGWATDPNIHKNGWWNQTQLFG